MSVQAPYSFRDSASRFLNLVDSMNQAARPPLAADAPRAAVIVSPWVGCPLPWFAITVAHFLRRRGVRTTLLWNDLCDSLDPSAFAADTEVIAKVIEQLQGFDIVRLSDVRPLDATEDDARLVVAAARANAVWSNRGSLPADRVERLAAAMETVLTRCLPYVCGFFKGHPQSFFVVPGGMYGSSGLYTAVGRRYGVRVSTYDSGAERLLLATTGPAACQLDIARCAKEADAILGDKVGAAREKARAHLDARRSGSESYFTGKAHGGTAIQVVAADADDHRYAKCVVLPLNVEWDTAAVGLHRFYRDDTEWALRTIAFLLERTDIDVVVRQHPATRVFREGAKLMADALTERFGHHPRFRFVSADEPVNSYKLLQAAVLVLPLSSTVGVEAVMLGKPIVMESTAYYAELPFAQVVGDEEAYFSRILECLRSPVELSSEQVALAELTYFFAAVVNVAKTNFTPIPDDFNHWASQSLDRLATEPALQLLVETFVGNRPAAAIRAAQFLPDDVPSRRTDVPFRDVVSAMVGRLNLRARAETARPAPPAAPAALQLEPPPAPPAAPAPPSAEVSDARAGFKAFANVTMGDGVQIIGVANVEIGAGSCIGDYSWLNVCERDARIRIRIGINVLIGRQSMVSTGGYLEIGDYCLFGPRCSVVDADHGVSDIMRPYGEQTPTLGRSIVVEENCWLGAGAVIAGHLTIGRGSVIGANSLVTKDVEPFSIVVGSPARLVKLYDPVTKQWERADNDADVARVEAHRRQVPLPERTEYRQILRRNSRTREIVPIVAGRGEWL